MKEAEERMAELDETVPEDFEKIAFYKSMLLVCSGMTGRGIEVTGYYSRNPESSLEAANFTDTKQFLDLEQLVGDSDAIFLTVPDGEISSVWEQLKELPIQGKIISHFSGAQSSDIFSERRRIPAYGYSIHPLFAFNDKYSSYKDADKAFYAIEGDREKISEIFGLLETMGCPLEQRA